MAPNWACRRRGGPQKGAIFFRQELGLAVAAANHMQRFTDGKQLAVGVAKNFVGKSNGAVSRLRDARAHAYHFVVARGGMVAAAHVGDNDVAVVFDFHALVFDAQRAHQLHATHLKPNQVIRVIDHAHLVGLRVAHAYCSVVMLEGLHEIDYSGLLCQTGLRFSRNDASPSLKSGVQRMRAFSRMARSRSASTPAAAAEVSRRFARVTLAGLAAIKMSASSFARSISFSAGTISLIRPISFASAGSRILPVSRRSRVLFSPICRDRKTETIAGRNPIFTSVYPNFASGTANVKSQSVAIPQPPASAAPFTAAMSGLEKLQMRRNIFAIRRESSWFSEGDCR